MTDGSNGPTEYFYLGNKLIAKESQVKTAEDTPGYIGHLEDDDLQLTYMQQRYYDPIAARFNSNDPVGFSADNLMLFNRYANNNPYTYIDPDGRETTRFSIRTDKRIERFAQGKLSEKEFLDEAKAEGLGALVGLAVVSPVDELTVAGAIAGKVISGLSKATNRTKGLKNQADDLVSLNNGKHRVTLRSEKQQLEIDLAGKEHAGIPTPHTKVSPRNTQAPEHLQPAYNTSSKSSTTRAATQEDIRAARKYLERQDR